MLVRWVRLLSALLQLLLWQARTTAAGSTLAEMCDCSVREAYGFRCGCGDHREHMVNGRPLNGCCNLGQGTCDDFCSTDNSPPRTSDTPNQLLPVETDAELMTAEQLREKLRLLQGRIDPMVSELQRLRARVSQPTAPSPPPAVESGGVLLPEQRKRQVLETAFQLQAISLEQFEAASVVLSAEIESRLGSASRADTQAAHPNCATAPSCGECRALGCAWCITARKCVEDKPWICAGETDHIGQIGKDGLGQPRTECPSRTELEAERSRRRAQEAAAAEERAHIQRRDDNVGCSSEMGPEQCVDSITGDVDDAESRAAELTRRVEASDKGEGGATNPYAVLGLDSTATQSAIRKAYRKLSLQLHPDKNPEHREFAQRAFADLVVAYEILGSPDTRTQFDDYGGAENKGFDTFREYVESGSKSAPNFYTGDQLVVSLTENHWERRLHGDSIWLVEFYAPWCSHCQRFAADWKLIAQALESEEIEVGAVNCQTEATICADRFALRSYPTIRIINRDRGMQQEYHNSLSLAPADVAAWAKEVAVEWQWLFKNAAVHQLTQLNFETEVLNSTQLWVVLFTDGMECGPCKTAQTNMLRLSAGLAPLAADVKIGVVNCEPPEVQAWCGSEHGMPTPPYAPHVKAWGRGTAKRRDMGGGEILYNANEVEPHLALELTERLVRLALTVRNTTEQEFDENGLAIPQPDIKFEADSSAQPPPSPPSGPPPRPRPMWNGPKRPDPLPWDGSNHGRQLPALGG